MNPNPSPSSPTQIPTMWGYPAAVYRQHVPAQGLIRACTDELSRDLMTGVPIARSVDDGLLGPLGPADIAYVVAGLPHAPAGYPAGPGTDWRGRLADALCTAAGYGHSRASHAA